LPSELAFDEAPQDVVNKVFNITLRTIMEGQSIVNVDEIHRAARFFYQARQRDLYGAGGSNAICADVQHKFLRIGVRCQAYPDAHIMMMSASLLQEGDVVLVVTHSGRTSDVKAAVELAKKNGAKIICITHSYHSPIAKLADYIICSPAPETPLLGRNASARILQLTLLDAFFVSVAQLNIEQANINMQKTGAIFNIEHNRSPRPSGERVRVRGPARTFPLITPPQSPSHQTPPQTPTAVCFPSATHQTGG
jgi:RpiR family transcriptional regulator, repressor of rpiB and als operon